MVDTDKPGEQADEQLVALNKLLVKALRELASAGRTHEACTFAGEAWSVLRHHAPREAERLNGLLHYLTAPSRQTPVQVSSPPAEPSAQKNHT